MLYLEEELDFFLTVRTLRNEGGFFAGHKAFVFNQVTELVESSYIPPFWNRGGLSPKGGFSPILSNPATEKYLSYP